MKKNSFIIILFMGFLSISCASSEKKEEVKEINTINIQIPEKALEVEQALVDSISNDLEESTKALEKETEELKKMADDL